MQRNNMALKRKYLYDGEEVPGLVESSPIKDEEGAIDVPGFSRKTPIKDGVKMLDPLDLVYKLQRDTITQQFFMDWFYKNEYHDITVIETDATGTEVNRWLLRDCECKKVDKRPYNAGAIEFHGVAVTLICTTEPVFVAA